LQGNFLTHHIAGRLNLRSILALAGIAGPVILIITDLIVAFSDPGYNFIRHSISSLAWARLGWIQTLGFLTIGLLTELFVAGLYFSIRGRRGFGFGIALLVCFGFGLLLIGAFHTDPATGPRTVEGTIHGLAAKFIFWLFPVAAFLIAPSLRKDPQWKPLFYYTIASGVFAIGFMINSIWMPPYFDWFGLFERILVADEVIWVEVMAIWMLRLSLQSPLQLNTQKEMLSPQRSL
jgi:hypothetical membrane protein